MVTGRHTPTCCGVTAAAYLHVGMMIRLLFHSASLEDVHTEPRGAPFGEVAFSLSIWAVNDGALMTLVLRWNADPLSHDFCLNRIRLTARPPRPCSPPKQADSSSQGNFRTGGPFAYIKAAGLCVGGLAKVPTIWNMGHVVFGLGAHGRGVMGVVILILRNRLFPPFRNPGQLVVLLSPPFFRPSDGS